MLICMPASVRAHTDTNLLYNRRPGNSHTDVLTPTRVHTRTYECVCVCRNKFIRAHLRKFSMIVVHNYKGLFRGALLNVCERIVDLAVCVCA